MYTEIIESARAAGEAILAIYKTANLEIEEKGDGSPLTKADRVAHTIIQRALEKTGLPILSEEGRDVSFAERKKWKKFWMVDPLDGTKEFIKMNGEFTVNIALIENGRPTYGIVHVPVSGETFYGGQDEEAVKIKDKQKFNLNRKSNATSLAEMMKTKTIKVVASRSYLNTETKLFLAKLDNVQTVAMGSSLKFLAIADAKAEMYPRFAPTMEWDTAASHAILNSLGYKIYQKQSNYELIYNKKNLLNPHFICF